tara:strand:- start:238 stop:456 length:219 start_codon:yes stop_codon:yes gene_type:complete
MNQFLKNFIQKLYENLERQKKILKHIENELETNTEICIALHNYLNSNIHLTNKSSPCVLELEEMWKKIVKSE